MKKRNILISLAIILGSVFAVGLTSPSVLAAECGGAQTSVIDCDAENQDAIFELIKIVIRIMTAVIGIVAVAAAIFGAILYGSAAGSPENVKKARTIWVNVIIGLILFAFMVGITNFLIPGGVF